jgi:FAD/FMN-containing dehydrogenase
MCLKKPTDKKLILLKVEGFGNVIDILIKSKEIFKNSLNAFEYIDYETYLACLKYASFSSPFQDPTLADYLSDVEYNRNRRIYVLMAEIAGDDDVYLSNLVEKLYQNISNLAKEEIMAETKSHMDEIWDFRDHLVVNLKNEGTVLKYDLSIASTLFEEICERVRANFKGKIKFCSGYGHIGDGNIHLQAVFDKGRVVNLQDKRELDDFIYNVTAEMNGSISAEHGIGQLKRPYVSLMKSPEVLKYWSSMKQVFDPNGILNPCKTLI